MSSPAITFDPIGFVARYPEFAALTQAQLTAYFAEAALYCANDTCNPAFVAGVLGPLLNMLTAHIAWLYAPRTSDLPSPVGAVASPLVGRITTASEGSVSVSTTSDYPPGTPQWFQQTNYGSSYWAATAQFRTMRYVVGPRAFGYPGLRGYGGFS